MPKSDRRKKLVEELIREVDACTKCRLYKYAKHAVPGEGKLQAALMLVGEAPGRNEDLQGKPFVGAAGHFLDEVLTSVDFTRGDVYITNIVKHRPPHNRLPRRDEVKACTPYLERQIRIVKPKVIVTLGNCSTSYLLSQLGKEYERLGEVRGKVFSGELFDINVEVVPTFHPAAVLYDRTKEETIKEDFQLARDRLSAVSSVT